MTAPASGPTQYGPAFLVQPQDASVPMGLTGTFAVQVSGDNLQYQWKRNGSDISGATASTYTTPATQFADSGIAFSVMVRNAQGTLVSNPAVLTVTARAPQTGDLRFQQVDAASTIHGYSVSIGFFPSTLFCVPPGGGGIGEELYPATGSAFYLTNDACAFQLIPFNLPVGVPPVDLGYAAYNIASYPAVFAGQFYYTPRAPGDPGSVITSFNLQPADQTFSFSFIHSETITGFDRAQYTVPSVDLPTAVSNEGLRGRVVTAISYDGSQATFFSYGWTADTGSVYETTAVSATLDTAVAQITQMASSGYLLTASGTTRAADGSGIVLVGTRLQGDRMPRPMLVVDDSNLNKLLSQGYAVVAVVQKRTGATLSRLYIGER